MDGTDRRILNALYLNADRSRKAIAREVGLSEPSLSKKIGNLQQDGVLKSFTINIDYEKAGFNTHSISLIRLNDQHKGGGAALVERLGKVNEAVEVYMILGNWDVYVRWVCASNAQVMNLIKRWILSEDSVGHVETITLGQEIKRERGPLYQLEGA